ncbi:hypothetical protein L484_001861 [Morus notabilis]|uniref:ABC transporter domain-containing protein n=1 Tax=Morus notabilis TaxID=981085 RepID=W9S5A1_9ROSA|nr:hypothetical protein L484_001861 [Morus notabilis]
MPPFESLDRKTEIESDTQELPNSTKVRGRIEFRNVKFKYSLRPEVIFLNKLSLQIEAGSKVAFVGPSGAGNSSIFILLLRFYDPQEVSIIIDGNEIKDNICYGNNVASETEFVEVLRQANMYEFISNLPDGYNAVVGEKSCPFSGGQKQRIGIRY